MNIPSPPPESTLAEFAQAWGNLSKRGVPERNQKDKPLTMWQRIEMYSEHRESFPAPNKKETPSFEDAIAGKKKASVLEDPVMMAKIFGKVPPADLEPDPVVETAERTPGYTLSQDQDRAWTKIRAWTKLSAKAAPYFVLRGFAGTGKSYLMKLLSEEQLKQTVYFTAPTNKAAKVLRSMLGCPTKTIFSLLGLKMSNDDEVQDLVWPDKMPELSPGCIIVVDEAGMCNTKLCKFIDHARIHFSAKILYVGDPAQLLPIGEDRSPCWSATDDPAFRALMKEVMRFDNQLLKLATHLRECVRSDERPVIEDDNDGTEGVFRLSEKGFWKAMLAERDSPQGFLDTKVVAWRNKTVDSYNERIRNHLGFSDHPYKVGELLMVAKPVEVGGSILATIDEELVVENVKETVVNLKGHSIPVYELLARVDGGPILKLNIPTDDDLVLRTMLSEMADKAKRAKNATARRLCWREFWDANNKFHAVRYGYAMTAHRIQGSTYRVVFVDFNDIMCNPDTNTANRCAYVSFSRPTQAAYTF